MNLLNELVKLTAKMQYERMMRELAEVQPMPGDTMSNLYEAVVRAERCRKYSDAMRAVTGEE